MAKVRALVGHEDFKKIAPEDVGRAAGEQDVEVRVRGQGSVRFCPRVRALK